MNYKKITFLLADTNLNDIIIALLAELPFTGFEEEENRITTYIPEEEYNNTIQHEVELICKEYQLLKQEETIAHQNWNAAWEADYPTVIVADFCGIRADFHSPIPNVEHQIVITPKMSFGTGHHATTHMMIEQMRAIDFEQKSVLDFGCGTGVLAILAHKLGATFVEGVDIDEWAYKNTLENIQLNNCAQTINVFQGELSVVPARKYDIILANINRNVLLDTMSAMQNRLKKGGVLLISGFLETDIDQLTKKAKQEGLTVDRTIAREQWRCMKLLK